jgi:hypothetical protein
MATSTHIDGLTELVDAILDRQNAARRELGELDRALGRLVEFLEARGLIDDQGVSKLLEREGA